MIISFRANFFLHFYFASTSIKKTLAQRPTFDLPCVATCKSDLPCASEKCEIKISIVTLEKELGHAGEVLIGVKCHSNEQEM